MSETWQFYNKRNYQVFFTRFKATKTAEILWIERKTINNWYSFIRIAIYSYSNKKAEKFDWIIELDESYFWPTRVRWKR